jgi:hypothetical protein
MIMVLKMSHLQRNTQVQFDTFNISIDLWSKMSFKTPCDLFQACNMMIVGAWFS